MPTLINDNRKYLAMTEEEADALLAEIADAEITLAAITAEAERKIADAKAAMEEAAAPVNAVIRQRAAALERYINAHPDRFARPRARRGKWGSYGLRTVSGLEIDDEPSLIAYALEHKLDIVEVRTRLNRTAVAAKLAEGVELPGATAVSGERSFYKVSSELLDEARRRAAGK